VESGGSAPCTVTWSMSRPSRFTPSRYTRYQPTRWVEVPTAGWTFWIWEKSLARVLFFGCPPCSLETTVFTKDVVNTFRDVYFGMTNRKHDDIYFDRGTVKLRGPEQRSRYSNSLRAGRSGNRNPVRAKLSAHVQTCPGVHPASYKWVPGHSRG